MKHQNQKTENIDLVRKIAWSFYNTTGIDWDELFAEASLAYAEGLETFDPSKGRLSTHMWHKISNHLKDYLKHLQFDKSHLEFITEYDLNKQYSPISFFESLSNDAYEIAKLVLTTPARFTVLDQTQVIDRIYHVMSRRGWPIVRTKRGLHDLRLACTNPN